MSDQNLSWEIQLNSFDFSGVCKFLRSNVYKNLDCARKLRRSGIFVSISEAAYHFLEEEIN